jgi:hypothetical protein
VCVCVCVCEPPDVLMCCCLQMSMITLLLGRMTPRVPLATGGIHLGATWAMIPSTCCLVLCAVGSRDWIARVVSHSGECAIPMFYRWTSPSNGNGIFWYSFDYGSVHVIQVCGLWRVHGPCFDAVFLLWSQMSTEHDWTQGSAQYDWLQRDLQALDRSVTPWVVVTGHRMMYTTQLPKGGDWIVAQHMQQELGGASTLN